MWRFSIYVTGRPAAWIASILFIILGALIAFILPALVQPSRDRDLAITLLHILGGVLLLLGAFILIWMFVDLYLGATRPERREAWFWWGNFLAGMIGAALFAIPATFAFPIILLAYLLHWNGWSLGESPDAGNNLLAGAIFSIAGLLALALMYFVGRSLYRGRPRRIRREHIQDAHDLSRRERL